MLISLESYIILIKIKMSISHWLGPSITSIRKIEPRDYRCPCGKTYRSYPALFTHIKQKHQGKAPGEIRRPTLPKRSRGRPSLTTISRTSDNEEDKDRHPQPRKTSVQESECRVYRDLYLKLYPFLKTMSDTEQLDLRIWDRVNSFSSMQYYLDNPPEQCPIARPPPLGTGLSQFLHQLSMRCSANSFNQILLLFMLLLEYTTKQSNYLHVLEQAPVQHLIEFMNPFISQYSAAAAARLRIQGLWVMQTNNMGVVFQCFHYWLKWKGYSSFCITIIE